MDVLRGRGHLWNKRASLFLSFLFCGWWGAIAIRETNKQTIFKACGHLMHLLTPGFLALEDLVSGAPLCILSPNKISCTSVMFFLFCFVLSVCAFSGSEAMLSGYGDFPSVPQSLILLIFSKG
jgi:hypothetical protein